MPFLEAAGLPLCDGGCSWWVTTWKKHTLVGISPCLLQAKDVPAHLPSFLGILEEEILVGQHSIALVAGLM